MRNSTEDSFSKALRGNAVYSQQYSSQRLQQTSEPTFQEATTQQTDGSLPTIAAMTRHTLPTMQQQYVGKTQDTQFPFQNPFPTVAQPPQTPWNIPQRQFKQQLPAMPYHKQLGEMSQEKLLYLQQQLGGMAPPATPFQQSNLGINQQGLHCQSQLNRLQPQMLAAENPWEAAIRQQQAVLALQQQLTGLNVSQPQVQSPLVNLTQQMSPFQQIGGVAQSAFPFQETPGPHTRSPLPYQEHMSDDSKQMSRFLENLGGLSPKCLYFLAWMQAVGVKQEKLSAMAEVLRHKVPTAESPAHEGQLLNQYLAELLQQNPLLDQIPTGGNPSLPYGANHKLNLHPPNVTYETHKSVPKLARTKVYHPKSSQASVPKPARCKVTNCPSKFTHSISKSSRTCVTHCPDTVQSFVPKSRSRASQRTHSGSSREAHCTMSRNVGHIVQSTECRHSSENTSWAMKASENSILRCAESTQTCQEAHHSVLPKSLEPQVEELAAKQKSCATDFKAEEIEVECIEHGDDSSSQSGTAKSDDHGTTESNTSSEASLVIITGPSGSKSDSNLENSKEAKTNNLNNEFGSSSKTQTSEVCSSVVNISPEEKLLVSNEISCPKALKSSQDDISTPLLYDGVVSVPSSAPSKLNTCNQSDRCTQVAIKNSLNALTNFDAEMQAKIVESVSLIVGKSQAIVKAPGSGSASFNVLPDSNEHHKSLRVSFSEDIKAKTDEDLSTGNAILETSEIAPSVSFINTNANCKTDGLEPVASSTMNYSNTSHTADTECAKPILLSCSKSEPAVTETTSSEEVPPKSADASKSSEPVSTNQQPSAATAACSCPHHTSQVPVQDTLVPILAEILRHLNHMCQSRKSDNQ